MKSGEDGFSVLEAMIAVFLLAAAFLPLLELQGRFVGTVESLERADVRITQRQIAENHLATLNFDLQPRGTVRYGRTVLSWNADVLAPPKRVRAAGGAPGRFTVTLYDVAVVAAYTPEPLTMRDSFTTLAEGNDNAVINLDEAPLAATGTPTLRYRRRGLGWTPLQSVVDSI